MIVVVDITDTETLSRAKLWKAYVNDKVFLQQAVDGENGEVVPCVLFVNKWDLITDTNYPQMFSEKELDEFCETNKFIGWFSVSAKTGLNIKKGINFTVSKIVERQYETESKSTQLSVAKQSCVCL